MAKKELDSDLEFVVQSDKENNGADILGKTDLETIKKWGYGIGFDKDKKTFKIVNPNIIAHRGYNDKKEQHFFSLSNNSSKPFYDFEMLKGLDGMCHIKVFPAKIEFYKKDAKGNITAESHLGLSTNGGMLYNSHSEIKSNLNKKLMRFLKKYRA